MVRGIYFRCRRLRVGIGVKTRIRFRQRTSERSSPRVSARRSRLRGWGRVLSPPPVHRTLDGASRGNLAALRTIPEPRARLLRPTILDGAPKRRAPGGELPIDRKLECCGEDPNESDRVYSGIGESRRCQLSLVSNPPAPTQRRVWRSWFSLRRKSRRMSQHPVGHPRDRSEIR